MSTGTNERLKESEINFADVERFPPTPLGLCGVNHIEEFCVLENVASGS